MGQVGLAGLVIEQVDLGAGIIDHDEVIQAVAIEVGHVELADLVFDGKDLPAGEAEAIGAIVSGQAAPREAQAGNQKQGTTEPFSDPNDSLQAWLKMPTAKGVGKDIVASHSPTKWAVTAREWDERRCSQR